MTLRERYDNYIAIRARHDIDETRLKLDQRQHQADQAELFALEWYLSFLPDEFTKSIMVMRYKAGMTREQVAEEPDHNRTDPVNGGLFRQFFEHKL